MALGHSPKIVTNGLVFAYDMGPNPRANKSWKGAPTTNIFSAGRDTDNSASLFTYYFGTGASGTIGSEYQGKGITAKTATITTSTNSYTNFQVYMGNVSLTGGSTYTVSAMVWTNVPFTCRIGVIQNGGSYTAYVPLNQVSLSYGWNFIFSVGTYATTVTDARFQLDFGTAPVGTTIKVMKPQIEQSNYATPYVNGTRSNTEALLDWTGNNTITIDKLQYNPNNEFNFDGTTGRFINLGTQLTNTGNTVSIECWFKSTAPDTSDFSLLMGWGNGNSYYSNIGIGNWFSTYSDESIYLGLNSASVVASYRGGHSLYHDNSWHHAVFVMGPANYKIYVDGESKPLTYSQGDSSVNVGDIFSFGQANVISEIGNRPYGSGNGPFTGQIPITRVYNRELTAEEINQNYNAFKPVFDGPMYSDLTFITTAGIIEYTNNGTKSVTFYKSGGTNTSWNTGAFCPLPFTAPCTIEYTKNAAAGGGDNGLSYAMIGWNPSPNNSSSYTDLDYAAYPYRTSSLRIYHNGSNQGDFGSGWDPNKRLYIVYDTDGYIRHYNGDTLIASFNYGTGNTVYIDTALYKIDSTYGGFTNIKACNKSWNGTSYV